MNLQPLYPAIFSISVGVYLLSLLVMMRRRFPMVVKLLLFIVSCLMLLTMVELLEAQHVKVTGWMQALSGSIELLVYPSLLLIATHLNGGLLRPRHSMHLLPFAVGFGCLIPFYYGQELATYYMPLVASFKFLVMLFYLGGTIVMTRVQVPGEFSKRTKLRQYYAVFITILSLLLTSLYAMVMANSWKLSVIYSDSWGLVIIGLILYVLAIGLFRFKSLLDVNNIMVNPMVLDRLGPLIAQLEALFKRDTVHLNPKLRPQEVAKKLGISSKELNYLLRQQGHANFNQLLASHRIDTFLQKLKQGEHRHKTLLSLALESGFNSKTSFNRLFKQHTGYSPREYLDRI